MQDSYDFVVTNIHHVIERETTREWKMSQYVVSKYLILINLGGIGEYEVNGKSFYVNENDMVLFSPNTVRKCSTDENHPWHFISIAFDLKHIDGSDYFIKDIPMLIKGVHRNIIDKFKNINSAWMSKSVAYNPLCRAYIQEILSQVIQTKESVNYNPGQYAKIELAKNFIRNNYTRNISVGELAEVTGLSQSHFRKVFRDIVGVTATQYAIYLRINNAKDLLASGSANVSEAAFQSGFKDIYYFSSMFKKVTGDNPSKYLK